METLLNTVYALGLIASAALLVWGGVLSLRSACGSREEAAEVEPVPKVIGGVEANPGR